MIKEDQSKVLDGGEENGVFSVDPNEPALAADENCLDLSIIEGNFNEQLIQKFFKLEGDGTSPPKEVETYVSVGFYDHTEKTTQFIQGYKPRYHS